MRLKSSSWSSDECRPLPCSTCSTIVAVWPRPRVLSSVSQVVETNVDVTYNGNEDEEVVKTELLNNETSREEANDVSVVRCYLLIIGWLTDRRSTKKTAMEY